MQSYASLKEKGRRVEMETQGRRPCEDRGRDYSDVATSQDCQQPPETGGGKEGILL